MDTEVLAREREMILIFLHQCVYCLLFFPFLDQTCPLIQISRDMGKLNTLLAYTEMHEHQEVEQ